MIMSAYSIQRLRSKMRHTLMMKMMKILMMMMIIMMIMMMQMMMIKMKKVMRKQLRFVNAIPGRLLREHTCVTCGSGPDSDPKSVMHIGRS